MTPNGLSSSEAHARLVRFGLNRLPEAPRKSALARLLHQLASPLVLTLLVAAAISAVVGLTADAPESLFSRLGDTTAILLIVVLNAFLGLYQESKAETALAALRQFEVPLARVWRDGVLARVPALELVVGDVIELESGDAIPADARVEYAVQLAVDESTLTGESIAAPKDAGAEESGALADRRSSLFLGTTVVRGKARAIVTATGPRTELGRIGKLMSETSRPETPLEAQLRAFGKRVLWACLAVSATLFAWGLQRGDRAWHQLLLEAVSFAVAAVPEGLPAITTIALALGMQRMARRGAIVRKLAAVETLGEATVICTDKTGTLTQNQMTVREIRCCGVSHRVTGEGYAPVGAIVREEGGSEGPAIERSIHHLLLTAVICNGARLVPNSDPRRWGVVGDPTEGALLSVAAKIGLTQAAVASQHKTVREIPFDSNRKRMTVIAADGGGREIAHVKGSADVILARSAFQIDPSGQRPMTSADRDRLQHEADRMAGNALRVLALARRDAPATGDPEEGLTFLGLVGMIDPPRAGVQAAIAACKDASIRVVMITGDHRLTAIAIARELGLWQEGSSAMTGPELSRLSDDALGKVVRSVRVFARTSPEQKLQIVRSLQAAGEIVAMTGDGVNDAPALREAHIGVAMGRGGADVARQAADLVITDDNFASIVDAVREGRAIYRNIQKFVFFLLSSNAGLAVAVFGIALQGSWRPLTPLMILWINLVTNGFPALALGIDAPDPGQMRAPPRSPSVGILAAKDYLGILYVGAVMGAAALAMYLLSSSGSDSTGASTMAFSLLALSPLVHAWSCRSPSTSIIRQRPLVSWPLVVAVAASASLQLFAVFIPALRPIFHTDTLPRRDWLLVLVGTVAVLPAVEVAKAVSRWLASGSHERNRRPGRRSCPDGESRF